MRDQVLRRSGRGEQVVLAVVAVACSAYVLWRISDAYRFYQDDLWQFAVAQESGLSGRLLNLDVFQHWAPLNRLAHLFLVRVAGFSLAAGMSLSALLVLGFLTSALWVLAELRTSFRARLIALVALGLSITVLDTAVWADASLHILPALIATDLVLAAHVRAVRTGRRRWHLVALGCLLAGVLTQERALLALPLLLLVDWFVLAAGRPLRDRLRLLRSLAAPLSAMAVLALVAGAWIYVTVAGGPHAPRPSAATTVQTVLGALVEGVVPPWLGVRLDRLSPLPVQLVILAVMLLAVLVLVRTDHRNAEPLALLGLSFLMYYGLLAFSPLLTPDQIDSTALRLHYGAYLLVPTVIAVSQLRFRREDRRVAGVRAGRFRTTWWTLAAAAVAAAVLVGTGGIFVRQSWQDERDAHAYLAAVARTRPVWSAGDVTLVPLEVPPTIARDWAEVYGWHELFLRFLRPGWVTQELGPHPMVLDRSGVPRPVELDVVAPLTTGDGVGCSGVPARRLQAGRPVRGEPLVLRLQYRITGPATVRATAVGGSKPIAPNWAVPLRAGTHTVVVPLRSDRLDAVQLTWTGAGGCVLAADVVRPVFSGASGCMNMDRYGNMVGPTTCPSGRRA